jgi:sec-independent protein translocase protein TatA
MGISLTNILIILIIVLILFGAGKLPKVMGDLGKGIKNFKNALNEEENQEGKKTEEKKD